MTYRLGGGIQRALNDVLAIDVFRWPAAWEPLSLAQRCFILADPDSPLRLLGLPSFGDCPEARFDIEAVDLTSDYDSCSFECTRNWIRLYRRSRESRPIEEHAGIDQRTMPLRCPDLAQRIDAWFAAIDAEAQP